MKLPPLGVNESFLVIQPKFPNLIDLIVSYVRLFGIEVYLQSIAFQDLTKESDKIY